MNPKELVNYLQTKEQKGVEFEPMAPEMATGQMPGIPALPGMAGKNDDLLGSMDALIANPRKDLMPDDEGVMPKDELFNQGGIVQKVKDHVSNAYGKIKAYKGATNPPTLQGFQDLVSNSTDTAKGYANGGMVAGQDGEMLFNPHAGQPDQALQDQFAQQRATVQKFSPEMMAANARHIANSRNSFGNTASRALGTLADSIMQGVARAGSGGFRNSIDAQQDKKIAEASAILPGQQKDTMEQMAAMNAIDKRDPLSAVNQHVKKLYGPLNEKLGLPAIDGTEDQIKDVATLGTGVMKAQGELASANEGRDIQRQMLAETVRNNAANNAGQADARRIAEAKAVTEAEAAKRTAAQAEEDKRIARGIQGASIKDPGMIEGFINSPETQDRVKLKKQLISSAVAPANNDTAPDDGTDFDALYANLPSGSTYTAPDGSTRRKP